MIQNYKTKQRLINLVQYAICVIFGSIIVVPVVLTALGGFKTLGQLNVDPVGWPNPFLWENYIKIFTESRFFIYFYNSMFIMVFTVILDVLVAGFAGFALSRFKLKGKEIIYNYILLGLLFPLTLAILPIYIQLRDLSLLDKYWGIILPQTAFLLPFHVMIFRGFIRQIPGELEDACLIDGHGKLGFLFKIVFPLSRPAIATVSVLAMVNSWNNYFLPLIVLNSRDKFTLPMGSMDFIGQYLADWNKILAFFTITMIPAILFYIYSQKHIISGLTAGAVKG
ncbi:MAG: carbohydrate ABC transporter permease [Spirochaetales bacterium]|nr:carbohydrate ABC transporter permease [Spirochaetales bacterium]